MNRARRTVALVGVLVLFSACASTQVTSRESNIGDEKIARPAHILVFDFAATPEDLPSAAAVSGQISERSTPQTAEEIEVGRKLGAQVAEQLAAEIGKMGLPARHVPRGTPASVSDLLIGGYFGSVDEGSAVKRILIGFGSGSAELKTFVEVHQQTTRGLRLLGSANLDSGGSKGPGVIIPVVVTAVTANPIGLVVGGTVKAAQELSGSSKIEASGKRTAHEIAEQLEVKFREQGWIQ